MKNKSFFGFFLCFLGMQVLAVDQNAAFYAVSQKDARYLQRVLKQNPQFMQTNDDGQTILHVAVLSNNWQMVKVILQSGFAHINHLDKHNKTAMDYAVEYGYNKMVRKLYKYNGRVACEDNAQYAQKIITRPFKILFGIGIGLFGISMFFLGSYIHAMNPAVVFGPHIRGCALLFNGFFATFFGITAVSLLIPGVSGWATRSNCNLSLIESIV